MQGVGAASVQAPVWGLETTCLREFRFMIFMQDRLQTDRTFCLMLRPMTIAPSVPIGTCQIPSSAGDVVPRERPRTDQVSVGKG